MKKTVDPAWAILLVTMVLGMSYVMYSDNLVAKLANRFAASIRRGDTLELTGETTPANGQDFSLRAEGAVAKNGEVQVYGVVSITPPIPGCTLIGVNKMQESELSPLWKCDAVFITQDIFLRLANVPTSPWYALPVDVRVIPTGASQK